MSPKLDLNFTGGSFPPFVNGDLFPFRFEIVFHIIDSGHGRVLPSGDHASPELTIVRTFIVLVQVLGFYPGHDLA